MKGPQPINGLTAQRREMEGMFGLFWEDGRAAISGEWSPAIDVSNLGDVIIVRAEVPGIDPKKIQVTLDGQVLTLTGEKKHRKEDKDEKQERVERSMGFFSRHVRLAAPVDESNVSATFKDGVLTVRLPKPKAAKGAATTESHE